MSITDDSLFPVTGYLIANLAVADLSVGILNIPFTVLYFELGYWPFGYVLCKIIPTTQAMSVMASIGTLAAISLGKCFFVEQNSRHNCYVSQTPAWTSG